MHKALRRNAITAIYCLACNQNGGNGRAIITVFFISYYMSTLDFIRGLLLKADRLDAEEIYVHHVIVVFL